MRSTVHVPNAAITLAESKETLAAYQKVSQGQPRPLLTDIRNVKSVDRASRVYAADQEFSSTVSAAAILVASPVSRMVGNFFLGVNRPPYPTRLFTSEAKAIEWLKEFLD